MIESMFKNQKLVESEFSQHIENASEIQIEILYPSQLFERIYHNINEIKKSWPSKLNICIFVSGINSTDQKFHGNCDIKYVRLDKSVTEIKSGSFQGFSSLSQILIPLYCDHIACFGRHNNHLEVGSIHNTYCERTCS